MSLRMVALMLVLLLSVQCGGDDTTTGTQDTAPVDGAVDATVDAADDVSPDTAVEDDVADTAPADVAVDTIVDTIEDTTEDTTVDTGADVADAVPGCPPLDACIVANCPDQTQETGVALCALQNCKSEYEACSGPFGSGTCEDIYGCIRQCAPDDDPCGSGCIGVGSYEASLAFLELVLCMETDCASEMSGDSDIQLQQCTLEKCQSGYEGCMGAFGDGACKDILKCTQSCSGDDPDCQMDCMAASSYDANLQFMDLGACIEEYCPEAFDNPMANMWCFMSDCADPINVCCEGNMMNCL